MSILSDLVARHTELPVPDVDHLRRLVAEWQLLSDLSFADLLLWVPVTPAPGRSLPDEVLCVAQVRPTTGPTSYEDDRVGVRRRLDGEFELAVAFREGRICREADPDWDGDLPVRREGIPVRRGGAVIALLSRVTNLSATRSPSALELAYLQGAAELCQMVAEGSFPAPARDPDASAGPRAGDGLLRLDSAGLVTYASPNALSAYRRLGVAGDVRGAALAALTQTLAADPFDGAEIAGRIGGAVAGVSPEQMEVEAGSATVLLRAMPLRFAGESRGALVLVRDVTDVRNRDRQLMTKDATIREIHHRVKNNLQTVAALLRLQARRVDLPAARAALQESVRRVASIALVHETLALSLDERVDFDGIVDRLMGMVGEVAAQPGASVRLSRIGSFGELTADVATPLVMVLTELMQNAVEHGFVGRGERATTGEVAGGMVGLVTIEASRTPRQLRVAVRDDGIGLPVGFSLASSERLGLQIVRTLLESELRGTIELIKGRPRGTQAVVTVPLIYPADQLQPADQRN